MNNDKMRIKLADHKSYRQEFTDSKPVNVDTIEFEWSSVVCGTTKGEDNIADCVAILAQTINMDDIDTTTVMGLCPTSAFGAHNAARQLRIKMRLLSLSNNTHSRWASVKCAHITDKLGVCPAITSNVEDQHLYLVSMIHLICSTSDLMGERFCLNVLFRCAFGDAWVNEEKVASGPTFGMKNINNNAYNSRSNMRSRAYFASIGDRMGR